MTKIIVFLLILSCAHAHDAPETRPIFPDLLKFDGRIVGGVNTTIKEFPYQASLQLLNNHWCSGAIISNNYILSAAHCIRYPTSWYSIRAGSPYHNSGGVIKEIESIYIHPNYVTSSKNNDITIIMLSSPLTYTTSIAPIALPSENQPVSPGVNSVITGWATLYRNTDAPIQLESVNVPIINRNDCYKFYDNQELLTMDTVICAGHIDGEKDVCQGDSGAPMAIDGALYGLLSLEDGCGQPTYPGVYTSVSYFRSYIREITQL